MNWSSVLHSGDPELQISGEPMTVKWPWFRPGLEEGAKRGVSERYGYMLW